MLIAAGMGENSLVDGSTISSSVTDDRLLAQILRTLSRCQNTKLS